MPYDVTIITVKPNTHIRRCRASSNGSRRIRARASFWPVLRLDIGDLNQIMLMHHYASEADLAADRDAVGKGRKPVSAASS